MKSSLQSFFSSPIINVVALDKGLTNKNYQVLTADDKSYFVKVGYDHNKKEFNYRLQKEILATLQESDITIQPIAFYPEKQVVIFPYVNDIEHLSETDLTESLIHWAKLLNKLHKQPRCHTTFDIVGKYHHYCQTTLADPLDLSAFDFIFHKFQSYSKDCLCHNDLVDGNCVKIKNTYKFIDFEFAGDNHPFFDIMSLISENNIHDVTLRNLFYRHYFKRMPTDLELADLTFFEMAHHRLWSKWALFQYEQLGDTIYYEIALDKAKQLKMFEMAIQR